MKIATSGAVLLVLAGCSMAPGTMVSPQSALPGRAPFAASSESERVLYAFSGGNDGGNAATGLALDAHGDLLGTTVVGGADDCGTAFKLTPQASGSWHGSDGSFLTSTLLLSGTALYGTTSSGGNSCDCGTIFKVNANTGKETVLHRFGSAGDGAYPYYGLTADTSGNLYGTTVAGGNSNQGTVFEYTP